MHECIIMYAGIVDTYGIVQLTLWVAFHALGLCWGIVFPFHYRRFKIEGRIKYIHVTTVVFALVFPAILALLNLIDGYSIAPGPIDACTGRNVTITYFTTILPVSVLLAVATSVLVILFWKIFKVRNTMQHAINICVTLTIICRLYLLNFVS